MSGMKLETVINDAENKIKGLTDREEGFVISRDGEILNHTIGNRSGVSPPRELIADNIFTHNHPTGAAAFSLNDITSFVRENGYEIRVTTSDGRFVSLTRGADGWDSKMVEDIARTGLGNVKMKSESKAYKKYGRNATHQQKIKIMEEMSNNWVREIAEKYGAIFKEGKL
jgi:hypothetical protein